MPDAADMAEAVTAAGVSRTIAATRSLVMHGAPVLGSCEACCEEDLWVLGAGGLLRCVDCREKLERRR